MAWAQSEHLTFKGVPIDGALKDYVVKMSAAGFSHLETEDGVAVLKGDFAGFKSCMIGVRTLKPKNLVHEIVVQFPLQSKWFELEDDYKKLKEMLTTKYKVTPTCREEFFNTPSHRDLDEDDDKMYELRDDRCAYYSVFKVPKGTLTLEIRYDGWNMGRVCLWYTDKINSAKVEADAMNDL